MLLTHCKSIRTETVQHFKKSRFSFIIWCSDMKCFEMFSTQYIDATFQRSFRFSHHYLHTVKYKYENDLCYPYICILWAMSQACMIIRCICVLGICFFAFLASSFALHVIHSRCLMVWSKTSHITNRQSVKHTCTKSVFWSLHDCFVALALLWIRLTSYDFYLVSFCTCDS